MKLLKDMTEPELRDLLNAAASAVESAAEGLGVERPHFATLLFNDPAVAQYVCNCDRADVIRAMRECADRLERRETVDRVEFPPGLGPTGDFPAGKLHERDEGGLNLAVGSDRRSGKVLLTFGKPIAWVGMTPAEAGTLADSLRWHANKMTQKGA